MTGRASLTGLGGTGAVTRDDLAELAPVLRRAVALDQDGVARVRASEHQVSVLVLLFGVLAARTIAAERESQDVDATVRASELLAWLDGDQSAVPARRDAEWRSGLPPAGGWQRIDTVPGKVVRSLVRSGAQALRDVVGREAMPGTQPRVQVTEALLDSVVLTVSADSGAVAGTPSATVTLRTLSALTRLGFLPPDSHVAVDIAGRWTRVAGEFGSVYAEQAALALTIR